MLDDFFTRALLAGLGLAIMAGPLGCFIVWRRMAYFGDTLAHSALLGVAAALFFEIQVVVGVFMTALLVAISLLLLSQRQTLGRDTLLGLISHAFLAIGFVVIAFLTNVRVDVMSYLLGDILAVGRFDLAVIFGCAAVTLGLLICLWQRLLATTVSTELAQAEGQSPLLSELILMLTLAAVVAVCIKIVGVLLITALLIIPAATARRFASTPERMAIAAALIGCFDVVAGLYASLWWDTPSGPSIVTAAFIVFLISLLPLAVRQKRGMST